MKSNDSTDESAPRSEENLDTPDFHEMLEGLEAPQTDSNKLKKEHGAWNAFMHKSMEDVKNMIAKLNFHRKTACGLPFVKHKVPLDHLSMHEIANMKMSLDEQLVL